MIKKEKRMKKIIFVIMMIMMLVLAACSNVDEVEDSGTIQTTPTSIMADAFDLEFEDAASSRTQLAFGTLQLQESEYPLSAEEAQTLLPLWQALLALESNPDTADEEINAIQDQIIKSMQPEQLQTIASMQITNADLTIFYTDHGLVISTPVPGTTQTVPSGGVGKDSSLTTEEKEATKAAAEALGTPVGTNSGSSGVDRKNVLTETVIEFLTELINK
jgi:hypothetical protein